MRIRFITETGFHSMQTNVLNLRFNIYWIYNIYLIYVIRYHTIVLVVCSALLQLILNFAYTASTRGGEVGSDLPQAWNFHESPICKRTKKSRKK